ncbi:hypothetical protein D3C81_1177020 [compost metagenome]
MPIDNRHGFGPTHVGQADKTNALWVCTHGVGQLFTGFEAFRRAAETFPAITQDQFLEGVVGTGLIIPRIQMNRPAAAADVFPGFDFATENARQLLGAELSQRIVRVKDDRQAIDGDDLFGTRAFQIAQGCKAHPFAVLDRAR